jgi:hypothetical protein
MWWTVLGCSPHRHRAGWCRPRTDRPRPRDACAPLWVDPGRLRRAALVVDRDRARLSWRRGNRDRGVGPGAYRRRDVKETNPHRARTIGSTTRTRAADLARRGRLPRRERASVARRRRRLGDGRARAVGEHDVEVVIGFMPDQRDPRGHVKMCRSNGSRLSGRLAGADREVRYAIVVRCAGRSIGRPWSVLTVHRSTLKQHDQLAQPAA